MRFDFRAPVAQTNPDNKTVCSRKTIIIPNSSIIGVFMQSEPVKGDTVPKDIKHKIYVHYMLGREQFRFTTELDNIIVNKSNDDPIEVIDKILSPIPKASNDT